jgi:hypothetical protein
MSASCCCCHNAHDCKNAEIGRLRVRAEDIISVCMDPLLDDDEKVDQALAHARRALEGK